MIPNMDKDPCCDGIPLPQLSDEAAVEILNFLQVLTLDFEIS